MLELVETVGPVILGFGFKKVKDRLGVSGWSKIDIDSIAFSSDSSPGDKAWNESANNGPA